MILISHRGNIYGKNPFKENKQDYIQEAIDKGFDVEIDVWCFGDGGYWLGHDKPQYHVDENFLENPRLWCHAKNIEALYKMNINSLIHCFWHQEDDVTLTSKGYLWTYPGKQLTKKSIMVVLDNSAPKLSEASGICSDYIGDYNEEINSM